MLTGCTNLYILFQTLYFRTLRACLTRFSITPSNASLSPKALSFRLSQYSNTSLALEVRLSSFLLCSRSSSSVIFESAASVVAHSILVACRSISGGGVGPFLRLLFVDAPGLSTDVEDALSCFNRTRELVRWLFGGDCEPLRKCIEGRMSFFCFDAGRISSRSTGTPKDTRNNRRVRDRTQFGGCNGGGATS